MSFVKKLFIPAFSLIVFVVLIAGAGILKTTTLEGIFYYPKRVTNLVYPTQRYISDEHKVCTTDSDCTLVMTSYPCEGGPWGYPKYTAINKMYKEYYLQQDLKCTRVNMGVVQALSIPISSPKCVQNKCAY